MFRKILTDIEKAKDIDYTMAPSLVENIRNLSEFLVYAEKFGETYFE